VVDRAVARIQRLFNPPCTASDALQKVQFEASSEVGVHARVEEALFAQFIRQPSPVQPAAAIELAATAQLGRVLQLKSPNSPRLLEEHAQDYTTESPRLVETKAVSSKKKRR
jgi:hypothetical protein